VVIIVVSLFTRPPTAEAQALVDFVRYPRLPGTPGDPGPNTK